MAQMHVPVSCLHYLSCVRKIWWGNRTPHCPLTPFTRPSRLPVFRIFLWWHQRVFGDWTSWRTYSRDFGRRSGNWALTLNPSESRVILHASGGQSTGASASASVLPMNILGWFPSGLTGLISSLSKGLSSHLQHHSLKASTQHSTFFMVQLSHPYMTTGKTIQWMAPKIYVHIQILGT